MEVFFLIFQKFFRHPPRPPHRGGEQAEKRPNFVRQPQKDGQNQAAQGEKIDAAAQGRGGHVVDAHLSVVPQQGQGEQPRRGRQPEQQVQQKGQRGQPKAPAQGAHSVIDQAQQNPQQAPLPKDRRLAQNIHMHGQRSSRARKPPRPPAASSS